MKGSEMKSLKYRKLYLDIRNQITKGIYSTDEPLPSIRKLSGTTKLSRTTVENAYNQLLLEGYIYSIQGVGYFVNEKARSLELLNQTEAPVEPVEDKELVKYNFSTEFSNKQVFDCKMWKKHVNHVLTYETHALFDKPNVLGEVALRKSIANYLKVSRNVYVNEQEIFIGAGIQVLLLNLLHLAKDQIQGLVIEDPGFSMITNLFLRNGLSVSSVPVIQGALELKDIEEKKAQVFYVSPAHQIPSGTVMKLDGRYQLLEWAEKTDSYIIEDDFNAELRYDLFPVPSLKSMDKGDRVIYLGSFSTYLLPTIRISFMILPRRLREQVQLNHLSQTTSIIDQYAFSRMIDTGDFSRHLTKLKSHYTKKTETLTALIKEHLDKYVTIKANQSGLNLLLLLKNGLTEEAVVAKALEAGISIKGIHDYIRVSEFEEVIIINYRGISNDLIKEAILALKNVFISLET